MDDILFRHTAIATPNEKSKDFLIRVAESECAQKLIKEGKEFDRLLKDSLKIDIPNDLADKILLEQSFAIEQDKAISNRWHIAIAASIAFIIGLSVPMLNNINHQVPNIGNVALQHVQDEYFLTSKVNEDASLKNVNVKLARYGGTLDQEFGGVYFVNYCDFEGTHALHMVVKGEKGRVTVFVVPEDANFTSAAEFSNERFKGISEHIGNAKVVIVGERDEPLEKMKTMLDKNIQWDI